MKYRLWDSVRNPGGGTAFGDDLAIRARRDARPGVSGSGPSTGGGSSSSAAPLWLHFQNVISWVRTVFPLYRSKMKGLDWGRLFREYGANAYDPAALEKRAEDLWKDDEVEKKTGISEFLLSGEALYKRKLLSLRTFSESQKEAAYAKQGGNCARCGKHFLPHFYRILTIYFVYYKHIS